jgi:hypothetical protein
MAWSASRADVDLMISGALAEYDEEVAADRARIRIEPEKWGCSPWGDESGGVWAVAVDGGRVLWFNDIEGGFNWSPYSSRGTIGDDLRRAREVLVIRQRRIPHQARDAAADHFGGRAEQRRGDPGHEGR